MPAMNVFDCGFRELIDKLLITLTLICIFNLQILHSPNVTPRQVRFSRIGIGCNIKRLNDS